MQLLLIEPRCSSDRREQNVNNCRFKEEPTLSSLHNSLNFRPRPPVATPHFFASTVEPSLISNLLFSALLPRSYLHPLSYHSNNSTPCRRTNQLPAIWLSNHSTSPRNHHLKPKLQNRIEADRTILRRLTSLMLPLREQIGTSMSTG